MNHATVVSDFLDAFLFLSMLVGMGCLVLWLWRLVWCVVTGVYNLLRGIPQGTPLVLDPLTKAQNQSIEDVQQYTRSLMDYRKASHKLQDSCTPGEICSREAFKAWLEECLNIEERMFNIRSKDSV